MMLNRIIQKSIRAVPWQARTAIKKIPLIAPLQRFVLTKFLEGREFVHEVDAGPAQGLIFPVVLPDDKGVWTGTYEMQFVNALADAVRPGDVCFDVGGWRGYCGGTMAVRGAARVVVFEPLPDNCGRIRRLIELNPSLPIGLVQAAAGDSNGKATFTVMDATSMGKLSDSPFQEHIRRGQSITVDVVSLDHWCDANGVTHPQVIKIDVEGAEMMVLHGARDILQRAHPTLFIEAHSRALARQITEYLCDFDYQIHTLETGVPPDGATEPEVCHIVAAHRLSPPDPNSNP